MQKKVWLSFIVLFALISPLGAQSKKSQWVDSVFNSLDLSGKIGQVLMVQVDSHMESQALEKLTTQIKKFKVGGVVFTGGGPTAQVNITNRLQQESSVPLLIGMNAEEGIGAVLDSTLRFAPPIMLGAIQDDSLLFFLGLEIAKQLKQLGVHINFAPTSNLSTTFDQDQLKYTSYGENRGRVASKVVAYQQGLTAGNILCVAKHYPEDGSQVDLDKLLPLLQLFEHGTPGVVTVYQHDLISPDQKKLFKSKQSIISSAAPTLYSGDYLKRQLNFTGLVFSFIPSIKSNKKFKAGDSEVFAFKAGNDVLLFPQNLNTTVRKMRRAIRKNSSLQKQLDESVKKILGAKFDAGLHQREVINTENLLNRINTPGSQALQHALFEKSITVVKDDQQTLPIKQLDNLTFASVSIGEQKENTFTSYLSKYAPFNHFQLQNIQDTLNLAANLQQYNTLVVAIFAPASTLEQEYLSLLAKVHPQTTLIIVSFDAPSKLSLVEKFPTLIQAYSNEGTIQQFVAEQIFGSKKATGSLPVTINENLKQGSGIKTSKLDRLSYSTPEVVGIDGTTLNQVSKIVREAIDQKTTPGCQIIIARHGKIVFEKTFGSQTYENVTPIKDQTIYDIASITKVTATLPIIMFLYERGLIDIYKKASYYLPELVNSNKKDITVKEILTHQAGLIPFIPFWTQTVKDSLFLSEYYRPAKDEEFTLQVAPNLYGIKSLRDSLWTWSIQSKLREKAPRTPYNYVYSDIGLYILHHINEKLLNQSQEDFLQQNLYEPLGAATMGYLPLQRFNPERIAPTENDRVFRKEILRGTVHDEGAAMLGGIGGHAGLFSNAHDLAKYGQMLLQQGSYGGQQYFKPETVNYFTAKQFEPSRRGLGWDKPVMSEWSTPTSVYASFKTYGHTGFTGTCIWVDPEFDLVYVFLSNSRFPDRSGKLITLNIRSRIQETIYKSIFNYNQYGPNQNKGTVLHYLTKTND